VNSCCYLKKEKWLAKTEGRKEKSKKKWNKNEYLDPGKIEKGKDTEKSGKIYIEKWNIKEF